MRVLILFLLSAFQISAFASSVILAWDPSPDAAVAGYNIYFGAESRAYTNQTSAGSATNATISGLLPGVTYYFAATAYDVTGTESDFSNEVNYSVPFANAAAIITVLLPLYLDDGSTNLVSIFSVTNATDPMRFWKLGGTGVSPMDASFVLTSTDLFSWENCFVIPTNASAGALQIRN